MSAQRQRQNIYSFAPFVVRIAGRQEAVRDGLDKAMSYLAPLQLGPDEASSVELVLAEALNNVVEHALADAFGESAIEIHGSHSADGLHLTLIDRGAPMPDGKAPVAKAPDLDVEISDLPEGGFGWCLIHMLATGVEYARVGKANHLSLHLPVGI